MRINRYGLARAGKVKGQTEWLLRYHPKAEEPKKKKPKTGRAKKRAQYENKILFGRKLQNNNNATRKPTGSHFNHSKIPKFIDQSHSPANAMQNWQSRVSWQNENPNPHRKWSKIEKKTAELDPFMKSKTRAQSHPQKTKGSTGKSIQRDRNEAAKIKLNTALYGTEWE